MNAKSKSIVIGVSVSVAVVAVGLGLGLGLGLKKGSSVTSTVTVKGSVLTEQQLPLNQSYVMQNDAYLVQDGTGKQNIKLFKAIKDQPQSMSDYMLVPANEWPIPLPSETKNRGSCFGGKQAKNACDVGYAGEFGSKQDCDTSKCTWGFKCRLNLACVPDVSGAFSSGAECAGNSACGWRYKCTNNACVLAPDGTHDTFTQCRSWCT